MIPVAQKLRVLILFQEYRILELAKSGNICDCMSWGTNGGRRYTEYSRLPSSLFRDAP